MNCERFKRYIVDFLADEITVRGKEELEKHLKTCASCRKDFDECKAVIASSREIQQPVFSDMFWEKKLSELFARRYKKERKFRLKHAFAAVASLILLSFIFKQVFTPPSDNIVTGKDKNVFVFNALPYSEERLLEIADYIDDKEAKKMLDMLFENDMLTFVYSNNF